MARPEREEPHEPRDEHEYREDMDEQKRTPNRLILCFDGTGNSFAGNTSDTNIVKLYDKFDRSALHQMHYYQPGIGTYTGDGSSVNAGWFGRMKRSISQTIDQGIATTFDLHVIAGYRFLMRYYGSGDRIYIFGFSRGAYTARFLARMVAQVGLLSKGNEELVPFAYKTYQDYEMGLHKKDEPGDITTADQEKLDKTQRYINNFKSTFCRHEHATGVNHAENESGIKVHFLGLFDTVSSVGTFDVPFTKTITLPKVRGTAEHVRHAVAIDERRVKFKAALLAQDSTDVQEDIKEVWFPGNHGDIGGGWSAYILEPESWWEKLTRGLLSQRDTHVAKSSSKDRYQLSDIALKWMIDELVNLPEVEDKIIWDEKKKDLFMKHFYEQKEESLQRRHQHDSVDCKQQHDPVTARIHDTMKFGGGSSWAKVIFWNFMEYMPFIKRWELVKRGENVKAAWEYVTFPLNRGGTRDIPPRAAFHRSVLERMETETLKYMPKNAVPIEGLDKAKLLKYIRPDQIDKHEMTPLVGLQRFFTVREEGKNSVTGQDSKTDDILQLQVG